MKRIDYIHNMTTEEMAEKIVEINITDAYCNSAWVLYFSEQEILDEDEKNLLYKKFRILFEWTSKETLTLTQLREMAKIAEIDYFT